MLHLKSNRRQQKFEWQSMQEADFLQDMLPPLGSPSGSQLRALSPLEHVAALQPVTLWQPPHLQCKCLTSNTKWRKGCTCCHPTLSTEQVLSYAARVWQIYSTRDMRNSPHHLVWVLLASCHQPCSASLHRSGNLLQTTFKSRLLSRQLKSYCLDFQFTVCLRGLPKTRRGIIFERQYILMFIC